MVAQGRARPSYRAILIYLLAIVGPTLVILYLGLRAVQRQREAITNLTASNLRLSGDRLVTEFERRALGLGEACLKDRELMRLQSILAGSAFVDTVRRLRLLLNKVKQNHPLAHHFFLWQGDNLRFPILQSPLPSQLEDRLVHEDLAVRPRFEASFAEAEKQELLQEQVAPALLSYQQSYELAVSRPLKALALSRIARCLQKEKQQEGAAKAFQTLANDYGDLHDLSHRPYALVAALELDEQARKKGLTSSPALRGLARDVARGRWELSFEQVEYYLSKFQERGVNIPEQWRETAYIKHLEFGRALQDGFRHHGPVRSDQVYSYTVTRGSANYQIYYVSLPGQPAQEVFLGFAADLGWLEKELLPLCTDVLGLGEGFTVTLKGTSKTGAAEHPLEAGAGVELPFKTAFPFWELSLSATALAQATAQREMLFFGGSTLVILLVLGMGVFLLSRDVSREMRISRMRADFVSAVSHELKTPLTLIRLYGETLLYGGDFAHGERRNFYEIITRESERLTHLIENVLDFSRIDRGQKEYHLKEGDLSEVIARTVEVYGQHLRRRGFSVETDLANNVPLVQFDPDAVSQAVLNLMDNAAKYSGESKFIGIQMWSDDGRVIFEVEDRGIGIPAEEQEKIFQRFYRAPSGQGKGGYGLGLFLVKHIMDAHGGRVELQSEVGRGSRFRLVFPVPPETSGAESQPLLSQEL